MTGRIEGAPVSEVMAAEVVACDGQEVSAAEEALAEQCDGLSVADGAPVVGIAYPRRRACPHGGARCLRGCPYGGVLIPGRGRRTSL